MEEIHVESIQILFTVHFITFLIAELVLIVPFSSWFVRHFIPSRQFLKKNDVVHYLDSLSKDCLALGISLGAASAIQYQITSGYNNGKYRNMRELRNAALVRMLATMLVMVIHSVSFFTF
jgi:hypothetical protein